MGRCSFTGNSAITWTSWTPAEPVVHYQRAASPAHVLGMTDSSIQRVQAGVPRGGQFAAQARAESTTSLEATHASIRYNGNETRFSADFGEVIVSPRHEKPGTIVMIDSAAATGSQPLVVMINDAIYDVPVDDELPSIPHAVPEMRITGDFGEVIISERDGNPGAIVMIDSSGATSREPLVVMINDDIHDIPIEVDESSAAAPTGDPISAEISETDRLLQAAYAAGDEQAIHELSARAAATRVRETYPDAAYLDLDWQSDGLGPAAIRDRLGDNLYDSRTDDVMADVTAYTTNLRAGEKAFRDYAEPAPAGHGVPFHLHLDRSLREDVWS